MENETKAIAAAGAGAGSLAQPAQPCPRHADRAGLPARADRPGRHGLATLQGCHARS